MLHGHGCSVATSVTVCSVKVTACATLVASFLCVASSQARILGSAQQRKRKSLLLRAGVLLRMCAFCVHDNLVCVYTSDCYFVCVHVSTHACG